MDLGGCLGASASSRTAMGDIAFPVGNAAEESTRGQFLISWQGGEGAFVWVETACQSAIFTEHLLCGTWKGKVDGSCP